MDDGSNIVSGDVETPSQTLTRGANATASKMDARGRKISVRRINALQFYHLTKLLGQNGNAESRSIAATAASVCDIDGMPVPFPAKEREVEFTIQRLDFEGMKAANEALLELAGDEGIDTAKNSQATLASA